MSIDDQVRRAVRLNVEADATRLLPPNWDPRDAPIGAVPVVDHAKGAALCGVIGRRHTRQTAGSTDVHLH